jgi:hypothetical protein
MRFYYMAGFRNIKLHLHIALYAPATSLLGIVQVVFNERSQSRVSTFVSGQTQKLLLSTSTRAQRL